MTALFAPDAAPLGHPYWWDGIDWPELNDPPPVKVDLLVIGAGYTGLSAAIAAHDAGASVAVIDAGQPGKGASTRNGGMVGAHPRLGWDALAKTYGEDTADAIFAEAGPSLEWLRSLIEREGIDCDLQETGRIQLAYTRSHFKAREALAGIVREKSRLRCEVVTREGLSNEIVTPLYHGGIVLPDHAAFQPAKFHLGLLEAVLRRGISVTGDCPATAHGRTGEAHIVSTPKNQIEASQIVLATNGYTGSPFRWFARRVFALPSYLIATEPLSANLIGELAPGRRMMVETRARHSYYRVSPDGTRSTSQLVTIGSHRRDYC